MKQYGIKDGDMGAMGGCTGQSAPNTSPGKVLGQGGLPLKKKVYPKKEGKLKEKKEWKREFTKYNTSKSKKKI